MVQKNYGRSIFMKHKIHKHIYTYIFDKNGKVIRGRKFCKVCGKQLDWKKKSLKQLM